MKIYFTESLKAMRAQGNSPELKIIFDVLSEFGELVLAEPLENSEHKAIYSSERIKKHYDSVISCIRKSDVVVLEVSINSLSSGFIVNKALELKKQVIVLHQKGFEPTFLLGSYNNNLQIFEYSLNHLERVLEWAFKDIFKSKDHRFNIMLPTDIFNYLKELSIKKSVPKAHIIRELLREKMDEAH